MSKDCSVCDRLGRLCLVPVRVFMLLTNLVFLPATWRKWLFGTGTRGLQVVNMLFLAGWAGVMWDGGLLKLPSYAGFTKLPLPLAVGVLVVASLLLMWSLADRSIRGRWVGGFALLLSSLIWLAVSISFWVTYSPLSTAMAIYPALAAISWLAGDHMADEAREELKQTEKGSE